MVDEMEATVETGAEDAGVLRIYEAGYLVVPTVKEEEIDKVVGSIRSEIEKAGGNFIAEGAPASMKLAYPITTKGGGKKNEHDHASFGWIKFEAQISAAKALEDSLNKDQNILRSIVFQTVREDTRAKMKAPTLREVRRTDTIKAATTHRPTSAEEKAPVSEEDLEKALKDITAE